MFGWLRKAPQDVFGTPRSGQWPRVRREHLAVQPVCQACGRGKELEVHHIQPLHVGGQELDPANLITLCGDPCHLVHGHLMSWTKTNATVVQDCQTYRAKLEDA